jgi:hypothetical protein
MEHLLIFLCLLNFAMTIIPPYGRQLPVSPGVPRYSQSVKSSNPGLSSKYNVVEQPAGQKGSEHRCRERTAQFRSRNEILDHREPRKQVVSQPDALACESKLAGRHSSTGKPYISTHFSLELYVNKKKGANKKKTIY